LAIADFDLFGWLKQQLSERTLDIEQKRLETITDLQEELPEDEVKVCFV
jgi:hypothetical protein